MIAASSSSALIATSMPPAPRRTICPNPLWHPSQPTAPTRTAHKMSAITRRKLLVAVLTAVAAVNDAQTLAPPAHAAPAPEVEYMYDVTLRRHYNFPGGTDALAYGHGICDKVARGGTY